MEGLTTTPTTLPSIKCSICGVQVETSKMGDHSCSQSRKSSRPLDKRFYQNQSYSFFPSGFGTGAASSFQPKRPSPPQRINTLAANQPYLPVAQHEPASATSADVSPISSPTNSSSGRSPKVYLSPVSITRPLPAQDQSSDLANLDHAFPHFPTTLYNATTATRDWRLDTIEESEPAEIYIIPRPESPPKLMADRFCGISSLGTSTNGAKVGSVTKNAGDEQMIARPSAAGIIRTRPSLASILEGLRKSLEDAAPVPSTLSTPEASRRGIDKGVPLSNAAESKSLELPAAAGSSEQSSCQPKSAGTDGGPTFANVRSQQLNARDIPERLREACRDLVKSKSERDYEQALQRLYLPTDEAGSGQAMASSSLTTKASFHTADNPSPALDNNVKQVSPDAETFGEQRLASPFHSTTFSLRDDEKRASSSDGSLASHRSSDLSTCSHCRSPIMVTRNVSIPFGGQQNKTAGPPYRRIASARSSVYTPRSSGRNGMRSPVIITPPIPTRSASRDGMRSPVALSPPLPLRNASRRGVVHDFADEYSRISTSSSVAQLEYASPCHTPSESASSRISAAWTTHSGSSRSSLPSHDEEWCSGSIPVSSYGFLHLLHSDFPPPLKPSISSNLPDSPTDPLIQKGRFSPLKSAEASRAIAPPILTRPPLITAASASDPPSSISRPVVKRSATVGGKPKGHCRGCSQMITANQKSVSSADGRLTGRYHKECFTCHECKSPFATAHSYVLKDRPYCALHYHCLNGSLCRGCGEGIEGQYLETTPLSEDQKEGEKFHPRCLSCASCHKTLHDEYFEFNGKVYCRQDSTKAANRQKSIAAVGFAKALPDPEDSGFLFAYSNPSGRDQEFLLPQTRYPERRTTKLVNMI